MGALPKLHLRDFRRLVTRICLRLDYSKSGHSWWKQILHYSKTYCFVASFQGFWLFGQGCSKSNYPQRFPTWQLVPLAPLGSTRSRSLSFCAEEACSAILTLVLRLGCAAGVVGILADLPRKPTVGKFPRPCWYYRWPLKWDVQAPRVPLLCLGYCWRRLSGVLKHHLVLCLEVEVRASELWHFPEFLRSKPEG